MKFNNDNNAMMDITMNLQNKSFLRDLTKLIIVTHRGEY